MMMSVDIFSFMVTVATLITACAPVVLIILWIKDWLKKQIW